MDGEEMARRNDKMKWLRFKEDWTLEELAAEYGISRQRVGQIVGTNDYVNRKARRVRKIILATKESVTDRELAERLDMAVATVARHRRGIYRVAGPTTTVQYKAHDDRVRWFRTKLKRRGHNVRLYPPNTYPFDMIVDDRIRVAISASNKTLNGNPSRYKAVSPMWRFRIPNESFGYDYLVCITGTNDVFVIPTNRLPKRKYMTFCYPTLRESMSKYLIYHNRYDLLAVNKGE